jgi:hypothetical protein
VEDLPVRKGNTFSAQSSPAQLRYCLHLLSPL